MSLCLRGRPTRTIAIVVDQLLAGRLALRESLDADLDYRVSVIWVDATGEHSQTFTQLLPRLPMSGPAWLRWILYALRGLLQTLPGHTH